MGNFSEIGECAQLMVTIKVLPHLRDHIFGGNAVFPAVESMQVLAEAARGLNADLDVQRLAQGAFEKFLVIDPQKKAIEAFAVFEKTGDGGITARLVTRMHLAGSGITRVKEHARLRFFPRCDKPLLPEPPGGEKSKTDMSVAPEKIYTELVPFGPSYRNILSPVRLGRTYAAAKIRAPEMPSPGGPLGSPFVLDAAFHAACVWGQRYSGFIGFPVGFDTRVVAKPTRSGKNYVAHMVPVARSVRENLFDLWIYTPECGIFEVVTGLRMRDVTGGRMKPPRWIQENN
ncbi:MAG: polyketide synthase dehydratase domain-containing protein [Thermodesulfobacteriota bacterium]